jgi:hypothetical protein
MLHRRIVLGVVAGGGLAILAVAWAAPVPPAPPSISARLGKRIVFNGVDDPKATLLEVLDSLARSNDLTFEINDRAFGAENLNNVQKIEVAQPMPLPPMKNVRLDTVLRKVLERIPVPSGAMFSIHDDHIEITTGAFQVAEVWGDFKGPHLPLVWASLEKIPLDEALRDLSDQARFSVLVDNRAAEKVHTPVTARLRNTPLDTAVRLLADMADLRSVHLDNVLYVTTKENAAAMEARLEKERGQQQSGDDEVGPRHRKGSGPNSVVNPPVPAAGM